MTIADKLSRIKQQIEDAEKDGQRTKGKLESIMSQLKDDHQLTSILQAERKIRSLGTEIEEMEALISQKMNQLEGAYAWENIT